MDNFTKSLKLTLEHEGGFVDHPRDPGGATNKGITLKTFKRAFGDEMSVDDLRDITMTEIESMVKPDGILDDLRWEPMVLVN